MMNKYKGSREFEAVMRNGSLFLFFSLPWWEGRSLVPKVPKLKKNVLG